MRIILIGQAAFAAQVLERLVQAGESLVGVFSPPDASGDPVQEAAERFGVPVHRIVSTKSPEVYSQCTALTPDLGVMAFVTQIVPLGLLNCPKLGTIQYHPSLLPKHRGASAINWSIAKGETKTGVTIFWPDGGIDTGPILLQRDVDISSDDTVGSLYFGKLFPLGIECLTNAVSLIKQGIAPRVPQDESSATYEGRFTDEHAKIDWSQPAQATYDLIRGSNPKPGAYTYLRGVRVKLYDCKLCECRAKGTESGKIVAISESGIIIAAMGGAIKVNRVQPESMPKMPAIDYAKLTGLKVGELVGLEH